MTSVSITGTIFAIIVIGLIIIFFISLALFIRRTLSNVSASTKESIEIGEKLDRIIEQNEEIISLIKKNEK